MLESLPVTLAVGVALGFLSGIGAGGGSLLLLWLTLVLGVENASAQVVNLLFFLFAGGSAVLTRLLRREANLRLVLPAIAAGCAAAGVFSFAGRMLPESWLQRGFGLLLLAIGLKELLYRGRKRR